MGRTTTPLKQLVYKYTERLEKVAELLGPRYREGFEFFLEGLDETISAFSHVGSVDPLEVLLAHLARKLVDTCREERR
ncbi:MAG: hypothetical protein QXT76_03360 [Sulfolobales archaeon]